MQKTHNAIAYEDTGKGPIVVLLHGFAEDSTVWKHQVAHLSVHYRVIAPDWPGSGLSPKKDTAPSMEHFADLLHAILSHESIDRCAVIGHSMGGYVALAFAEAYAGLLTGLGLFHSTAFPDTKEKIQLRRRAQEFMRENGAAPFVRQSTPNLFAATFKEQHPDEVTALVDRSSVFTADTLIGYYEAMIERPDRTRVLAACDVPVLLIGGAQDNAVPIADTLRQSPMAATTFLHVLEDVAHMGMWEAPIASEKILTDYLGYIYKRTI
ncbi:MAG TPA: alpha/beta hydrolase [Dinghuibacter sp.]|jgi:pimeloyl-ACP methyl ester carboxylesterase|uniref:alpha/beta fold hydrolase n=1 Tax=Dinghuibacter sp. TaxID=2024697 RepID=UPI002C0E4587|nr:alpha/beta hydrolase [Dinghuibacter sp.]HTJ13837.1 alpha/beta hydrolase [Dinghuibacter sp.]